MARIVKAIGRWRKAIAAATPCELDACIHFGGGMRIGTGADRVGSGHLARYPLSSPLQTQENPMTAGHHVADLGRQRQDSCYIPETRRKPDVPLATNIGFESRLLRHLVSVPAGSPDISLRTSEFLGFSSCTRRRASSWALQSRRLMRLARRRPAAQRPRVGDPAGLER